MINYNWLLGSLIVNSASSVIANEKFKKISHKFVSSLVCIVLLIIIQIFMIFQ